MNTIKCPVCGKAVHWYNPRVGSNRVTRVCEHQGQDGKKCPTSRKPLHEMERAHRLKPHISIPVVLLEALEERGWRDVTDRLDVLEPAVLFISPDKQYGLYIDATDAYDEQGDYRPKYNLMTGGKYPNFCDDILYDDDLAGVLQHIRGE